jgi:ribonucleotide reductase beta subunit family protein with ferritin-like domain
MTVFNTTAVDYNRQPMFFGEKLGVSRYDQIKYPIFEKLTRTQNSFFWAPEEINLSKDFADFKDLSAAERHIFIKNISYQILLDSVQERSPVLAFLPWVSSPELEPCILTWSYFEAIHARSYQYILQNVFNNPTEIFDAITADKAIMQRASAVTRYYDDFIGYSTRYQAGLETDRRELKRKFYLALISVYALEALRFYVSFACSFAFGQLGKMTGNARIIKLIARDEAQHMAITLNIIRNYQKKTDDPEMTDIAAELESQVLEIFEEVLEQERSWAGYLFRDGSIIGLNEALLINYIEHIAGRRMRSLGIRNSYEKVANPFTWINQWLEGQNTQTAPQEAEILDYRIGNFDSNVNDSELLDL